ALLREGQQEHGGEEQARLEVGAAVHAAVGAWGVRGERATVTGGHPPWLTHFTPSRTRVRARSLLRCPWLLALGHRATANRNTLNGRMQRHRRRRPNLTCPCIELALAVCNLRRRVVCVPRSPAEFPNVGREYRVVARPARHDDGTVTPDVRVVSVSTVPQC